MTTKMWLKMGAVGVIFGIGGPVLMYYVTPTEEELFSRYNPDLQKRSLERQEERQQEFDDFVTKLKEYSKSNKPIWVVAAEAEAKAKLKMAEDQKNIAAEIQRRREEIKKQSH